MQKPDFWEDKNRAAEKSKELAVLKGEGDRWERIKSEIKTLAELLQISEEDEEFQREAILKIGELEKRIGALEWELYFSGKYDKGNAILSVYAGAGGKDAEDWAALLLRMFRRFAEKKEWKVKTVHEHWGEFQGPAGWGIKNATIIIETPYAYGYLKKESGVHRLVRISPFSAQSLRHTSFALVDVMPEFVPPEEVEMKPEDLKIDFFRSSGPGGQNVNKRETAVRITHLPTGLQVASQVERSQDRNREMAMSILRSRLYQLTLKQQEEERRGVQNEKVKIEWGNQIRSYVMHPYQMVKDHRTGVETGNIDAVMDGELDEFIEAEIKL
ncbi:MAG: peptide chain release factor 2 [Parcubacteria group bacterium Gr01-1014_33]|nr:MAG: peptide chain release factor 2 [Parcubacteria group bacterium Gr01-1014_33]